MKTVETENEGLKRAYTLTIEAKEIEAKVEQEIRRIAPQVQLPGFRPGKVPPNLVRKRYGESIHGDALNSAVQDGVQKLLADHKIRPAMQPEVQLDDTYAQGKDAQVSVRVEALPDVPTPNIEGLKLERLTVAADETAVDEQIKRLADNNKSWSDAPKGHKAAIGDLVVLDYAGSVDGEAFEGGTGEDMQVELGSGRLIPGFEDGVVGAKAGDKRDLNVTFPDDYPVEKLKGKPAVFAVSVKAVKLSGQAKLDDDFAKTLGLNDLEQLRTILREQQEQELNALTRTHMKRRLLDQLAASHDFPVPQTMVDAEYDNIMQQLRHEASHEADPQAALDEIEKEAGEYRAIAERRVRLGLLLSEIGNANGIEVNQTEMNRLVAQAAQQYQGKDRERFIQYLQQEPMAAAQLRAPLYEDKVVDFLFSKAEITDREVDRAEIEADLESEEGHVHGPDCGHDHGAAAKPAKAAKAKVSAKESKPAKAKAASKKADLVAKDQGAPKPAKPVKSEPANARAAKAVADKPAKAAAKTPAPKKPSKK